MIKIIFDSQRKYSPLSFSGVYCRDWRPYQQKGLADIQCYYESSKARCSRDSGRCHWKRLQGREKAKAESRAGTDCQQPRGFILWAILRNVHETRGSDSQSRMPSGLQKAKISVSRTIIWLEIVEPEFELGKHGRYLRSNSLFIPQRLSIPFSDIINSTRQFKKCDINIIDFSHFCYQCCSSPL